MVKSDDSSRGRAKRRRAPLSPLTVIGELLIVAGLAVFGYIVWQPWHTGVTVVNNQVDLSNEVSAAWSQETGETEEGEWDSTSEIPTTGWQAEGEIFGILHVPAFGTNFSNVIAEGTNQALILDPADKGIGRYTNTQQFGETGNVAIAAHRSGPIITPFREVMELRIGDPLFVETRDGWYTYRFRSLEYALPTEVDVLNPFPRLDGAPGEDQVLTLTTCHPKWAGSDERVIAYAILEGFSPAGEGIPEELQELNPDLQRETAGA